MAPQPKTVRSGIKSNRVPGLILRRLGALATVAGAGAVIAGSVLPWLQVPLFGTEVAVPGLLVWGGVTLSLGLIALAAQLRRTAAPWISLAAGGLCALLGWQAQQTVGRAVARYALDTQMRLAPVNARLEQINVPPIEPFGPSVGLASRWVGPGPGWVLWGALGMTAGGVLQMGGARWGRTCARCHRAWATGRNVHFCPHCGAQAIVRHACPACHADVQKSDRFCVTCGAAALKSRS